MQKESQSQKEVRIDSEKPKATEQAQDTILPDIPKINENEILNAIIEASFEMCVNKFVFLFY